MQCWPWVKCWANSRKSETGAQEATIPITFCCGIAEKVKIPIDTVCKWVYDTDNSSDEKSERKGFVMPRISEINPETAPESIKKIIADHVAGGHALTAEKRTLLHNAAAFNAVEAGSYALDDELQRLIGKRAADFYEYAISQKNGCLVCSIYFQNLLKKNGIDFENFAFTPKEEILIEYGQAIAEDPKHVPEELFAKLKANFTEEEIVVITAMGVMMIANNYFNDILDVTPDKLV